MEIHHTHKDDLVRQMLALDKECLLTRTSRKRRRQYNVPEEHCSDNLGFPARLREQQPQVPGVQLQTIQVPDSKR